MEINDAFARGLQQDRSNTVLAHPISSCQRLLVESDGESITLKETECLVKEKILVEMSVTHPAGAADICWLKYE